MQIIIAFLRLTKYTFRKVENYFSANSSDARQERRGSEATPLSDTNTTGSTPSLTDDFEDFSTSWNALRVCLFHVVLYYAAAVLGFSVLVEQWSVIDSLYFATVVWTTVGYGDKKPTSHAGMFYTIFLALYGVALLGMFLGIAGDIVVQMYTKSIEQNRKNIRAKVLEAMAASRNRTSDSDIIEQVPSISSDGSKPQQASLLKEILSVVILEAPILLIVLALALLVGRSEGWDWQVSLYYAVVSGTTIGFGDYSPTHQHVRLYCCFLLPLMVMVLGEFLARIAAIYMNRKRDQAEQHFLSRSLTLCDLGRMDTNHDGVVDKGEFLVYMLVALQKVEKEDVDEILALYNHLDRSKDGRLTKEDLRARDWDGQFQASLSA